MAEAPVILSIPEEIVNELARRCQKSGLVPDRLVAALLLNHLEYFWVSEPPKDLLDKLDAWEKGDRKISEWESSSS